MELWLPQGGRGWCERRPLSASWGASRPGSCTIIVNHEKGVGQDGDCLPRSVLPLLPHSPSSLSSPGWESGLWKWNWWAGDRLRKEKGSKTGQEAVTLSALLLALGGSGPWACLLLGPRVPAAASLHCTNETHPSVQHQSGCRLMRTVLLPWCHPALKETHAQLPSSHCPDSSKCQCL